MTEQATAEDRTQNPEYEGMSDEELFDLEAKRRSGLMSERDDGQGEDSTGRRASAEEGDEGEQDEGEQDESATQRVAGERTPQQPVAKDPARVAAQQMKPKWYADLPEEAQEFFDQQSAEFARLRESYTAVHGRLAPVQQENLRLSRQLADLQKAQRPAGGDPGQGGQPSPAATPETDLQHMKDFQEFKEAFPDEARAIEALVGAKTREIDSLRQTVQRLDQGFSQIQESTAQRTQAEELGALNQAHPDWAAVRWSDDFGDWLQYQPRSVQQMVDSSAAADCIYVLDQYKRDCMFRDMQLSAGEDPNPQPPNQQAQRAVGRRETRRNLPPSPPPSRGGVGVPGGRGQPVLSEEDLFHQEAQRRARMQR